MILSSARTRAALVGTLVLLACASCATPQPAIDADAPLVRRVDLDAFELPDEYRIEVWVRDLDFPTDVTFAPDGRAWVAECGPHGWGIELERSPPARIRAIGRNGNTSILYDTNVPIAAIRDAASTAELPEGLIGPVCGVTFHPGNGLLYVSHRGRISTLSPETGEFRTIIDGLPTWGPFSAGKVIVDANGDIVFALPTQTNAGVVDERALSYFQAYGKLDEHDRPGATIELAGRNFEVESPDASLASPGPTGAFVPLGTRTDEGFKILGQEIANGAFYRAGPDGSNLRAVAWGFRNPFDYDVSPDGRLIALETGADPVPPRAFFRDWDAFYEVREGRWYGWPDFRAGLPVADPRFRDAPDTFLEPSYEIEPLLTETTHRELLGDEPRPPVPLLRLEPHIGATGFAFASPRFGLGQDVVVVAEFGTIFPELGLLANVPGFRVARMSLADGRSRTFIRSPVGRIVSAGGEGGGLERPIRVEFAPDGALVVVDWGILAMKRDRVIAHPGTGVLFRVTPVEPDLPNAPLSASGTDKPPRGRTPRS